MQISFAVTVIHTVQHQVTGYKDSVLTKHHIFQVVQGQRETKWGWMDVITKLDQKLISHDFETREISPCFSWERWGNVKATHLDSGYGYDSALHILHTRTKVHLFARSLLNVV